MIFAGYFKEGECIHQKKRKLFFSFSNFLKDRDSILDIKSFHNIQYFMVFHLSILIFLLYFQKWSKMAKNRDFLKMAVFDYF